MTLRNIIGGLLCTAAASAMAEERVDLAVVHAIKHEAFRNSQVMDHLFHLTDRVQ